MRYLRSFAAALVLLTPLFAGLVMPARAWAQAVTASDIDRLEATADGIAQRVPILQKSDATLASEVGKSLSNLRDDITYLRVKMRREGSVTRAEYTDVHDRLETLRIKAQAEKVSALPMLPVAEERIWTVPVGTQIDVRLQTPLNSGKATLEQRFEATTIEDFTLGADVVIPAGSTVRGFVSSVQPAGKLNRKGSLTLSFDEMLVGGRPSRLRASVVKALDGKMGSDATKLGAGAAVGAVLGGILGGGKGALLGGLVGAGGTMAATEGSDVDLPIGTILEIRIDQPLEVTILK